MKTGWMWHERFGWYDTGRWAGLIPSGGWAEPDIHMENGDAKRRFASLVSASGLEDQLEPIKARVATDEELLRVHTSSYLAFLTEQDQQNKGGYADREMSRVPFGKGDLEIARLAAGGVIDAAGAVADGTVRNAYALARPPGHHALPDTGMGFCVFANIPLAIRHVREVYGIQRFAVVDWDVHHGNGTQDIFYDDPDVLTVSLHQDRLFPDGGLVDERGSGAAVGACVNIPLPPGCGSGAYRHAFDQVVLPVVDAFAPEMVFIASGFDSSSFDPNGRMMLRSDDYAWMTAQLMELAERHANGRVVAVHEGGYSAFYSPFCGLAVVETLSGQKTPVEDPMLTRLSRNPYQELAPYQKEYVDRAAHGIG